MIIAIGPDVFADVLTLCAIEDDHIREREHIHVDRWGCPSDGTGEPALAALQAALDAGQDHPNHALATHLADVFVAAATVATRSNADYIEAGDFEALLPHLCIEHLRAAVVLLACLNDADATGKEGRLTFGLRWVKRLLAQS